MILQRLFELAQREQLLGDLAFVTEPVACMVNFGENGRFLGLKDLRERITEEPKRKGGVPRVRIGKGKPLPIPIRPVVWQVRKTQKGQPAIGFWKITDPAAAGAEKPAVFLTDTLARVLPIQRLIPAKDRAKFDAQRSTFWRFLEAAAKETSDPALGAALRFAEWFRDHPEAEELFAKAVEENGLTLTALCTLAYSPDEGATLAERPAVANWWRAIFQTDQARQQQEQQQGFCQVLGRQAVIPTSVKHRINGLVALGCRADAYLLAAFPATVSYGLDGIGAGTVSEDALEGFSRAFNAVVAGTIPQTLKTYTRIANVGFLYWTRDRIEQDIFGLLENPTERDVADFLQSFHAGKPTLPPDVNKFYCLSISGNSAYIVVRDYLEQPLPTLKYNIGHWFNDLRIIDVSQQGQNQITARFPLFLLAVATVRDADDLAAETVSALEGVAFKGLPVPEPILAGCLKRLRVDGSGGFRAARMALIKLFLLRRKIAVTETLNPDDLHPAYVCGQLLEVFEHIQYAALGKVNATVTDKFFGMFSCAPAMVLGRLFANSQNHLRKMRAEKPGRYINLDRLLTAVSSKLVAPPRGQLSLEDQGRFALGYYHQKAKHFQEAADRKAAQNEPDDEQEDSSELV
jgi:CRISPR-associated protein Csd1